MFLKTAFGLLPFHSLPPLSSKGAVWGGVGRGIAGRLLRWSWERGCSPKNGPSQCNFWRLRRLITTQKTMRRFLMYFPTPNVPPPQAVTPARHFSRGQHGGSMGVAWFLSEWFFISVFSCEATYRFISLHDFSRNYESRNLSFAWFLEKP